MRRSAFGSLDAPGTGWVRCPSGSLEPVWWAVRALWTEVFGFRFQYPVELVPDAGPRSSLRYYVYSERLFFDWMRLDEEGVPCQHSRTMGRFYNPAYVAWYGLMTLESSLRGRESGLSQFQIQTEWLVEHAVSLPDRGIVWTFPVDVCEGRCRLKTPWISGMIQGLALSALVRAHRLGWGPPGLIDLCLAATRVFSLSIGEGGVRSNEADCSLYEEYPAYPLPRVLDGFLFSLLGLYDLWIETEQAAVRQLFEEGVAGLVRNLGSWNYRDAWSWYGTHGYLCPPQYHTLNRLLLASVGRVAGEPSLQRCAAEWDPRRLSPIQRAQLFMTFVRLKNLARLRAARQQG